MCNKPINQSLISRSLYELVALAPWWIRYLHGGMTERFSRKETDLLMCEVKAYTIIIFYIVIFNPLIFNI